MRDLIYNFFGSGDSIDRDVMVYVDEIPSQPDQGKKLCTTYANLLFSKLGEVDCNLGVVKDGVMVDVVKGGACETNNSVLHTYHLHNRIILYR